MRRSQTRRGPRCRPSCSTRRRRRSPPPAACPPTAASGHIFERAARAPCLACSAAGTTRAAPAAAALRPATAATRCRSSTSRRRSAATSCSCRPRRSTAWVRLPRLARPPACLSLCSGLRAAGRAACCGACMAAGAAGGGVAAWSVRIDQCKQPPAAARRRPPRALPLIEPRPPRPPCTGAQPSCTSTILCCSRWAGWVCSGQAVAGEGCQRGSSHAVGMLGS